MSSFSARDYPYFVAGRAIDGRGETETITNPDDDAVAGHHRVPTSAEVEQAVQAAVDVRHEAARTSAAVRAEALMHVSDELTARQSEVADLITAESGKPLMWSRAEVNRGISTFRWAAEEARRWSGHTQRLDTDPAATGRYAVVRRFPIGPILGIAPFNFPLNLVAHKVAPAIAVGAPIVIKPAPATPLTALLLGEILAETDLPEGMWSVLPVSNDTSSALVDDPRLPIISFTGSERVGFAIQRAVPDKHVTLELGGNAAAVVLDDWSSDEDLQWAASRIATFANYQAGQSCISVQRVLVDESIADRLEPLIIEQVAALRNGSPWDETTVVGPVINEAAAERIEQWIGESVTDGATIATGGQRQGCRVEPTVLTGVPADSIVNTEEVFGPVLTIGRFSGVDEAYELVNSSRFGLQAGIFTHDVQRAFRAQAELDVGGVIIGDVPSFRADQMPYGGVKNSGVGREGLRSAMEDFTIDRVLVFTGVDL